MRVLEWRDYIMGNLTQNKQQYRFNYNILENVRDDNIMINEQ